MTILVLYLQSEIDVTDNSGNTALQIVCGGTVRENSVVIIRLLLDKKVRYQTYA